MISSISVSRARLEVCPTCKKPPEKVATNMKKILAGTRPGSPQSRNLFVVDKDRTYRLRIRRPNEGLTVLRFLCTKFYARGETLTENEKILLLLIVEYFKDLRNPAFGKEVNKSTELLSLFHLVRIFTEYPEPEYPTWLKNQVAIFIKRAGLMTPRAFLGYENTFSVKDFIRSEDRSQRPSPPPQRYIGVGYRDKGNCRNSSYDGSPSWQEVASRGSHLNSEPFGSEDKRHLYGTTPFRLLST